MLLIYNENGAQTKANRHKHSKLSDQNARTCPQEQASTRREARGCKKLSFDAFRTPRYRADLVGRGMLPTKQKWNAQQAAEATHHESSAPSPWNPSANRSESVQRCRIPPTRSELRRACMGGLFCAVEMEVPADSKDSHRYMVLRRAYCTAHGCCFQIQIQGSGSGHEELCAGIEVSCRCSEMLFQSSRSELHVKRGAS